MRSSQFRELFPFFNDGNPGGDIVYFDNAATSQRPAAVIEKMNDMLLRSNANIHRAVHSIAVRATEAYENARDAAQRFLGASSREEIIFTQGATGAINLVAYSFSELYLNEGDNVIVGEAEHHSNLVPWQLAAKRKGAKVVYLPLREDGLYDIQSLESLITSRTRIVCISHASNVLGVINPIGRAARICRSHNVPLLVDGSQGAVHKKVDVEELGCDFYVFSAHKLYGPTGVGVLYGRKELLEKMPPFLSGGEMVDRVSLQGTTFAPLPMKFEAGTQNFINVATLPKALEIADNSLKDKELNAEMEAVCQYLEQSLKLIDGLRLYGSSSNMDTRPERIPVFSFTIDGLHHEDLAILLDKMGVAVRSGQMCAEPLMAHFGVTGMLRASLLPYNTMQEAERFIKELGRAVKMLV